MHPVLFELGGRSLYGYWFFYGLGMLLGALLCMWLGRRRSLPFWKMWTICVAAVLGAFFFARLSYLFFDPTFDVSSDLRSGGEISFGGLFGAALVFIATAALLRLPIRDVLDTCAPTIFLAQGIQRLGCFCNGCCQGPVSDSFLSVRFPKIINLEGEIIGSPCFIHHLATDLVDRADHYSLPVIPMQFVSMAVALTVAAVGTWMFLAGRFQGRLLWLSFATYGPLRFITQWFRPNYDRNNRGSHLYATTMTLRLTMKPRAATTATAIAPTSRTSSTRPIARRSPTMI